MLSQPNNLAGADCWENLMMLQRLLAAAQPERYAAGSWWGQFTKIIC
jgi:hypothetical protein